MIETDKKKIWPGILPKKDFNLMIKPYPNIKFTKQCKKKCKIFVELLILIW